MIDRAERRLNNLGYFKTVKITNEPGSTPDRIIIVVDVEDQPTGSFSVSGGYSTSDGFIGEVSVTESNFLGRGQYVRVAGSLGQSSNGVEFSFTEPYFLGQRHGGRLRPVHKYQRQHHIRALQEPRDRRHAAPRPADHGRVDLRHALRALSTDITIPNSTSQPFNDCSIPIPGITTLNPDGR